MKRLLVLLILASLVATLVPSVSYAKPSSVVLPYGDELSDEELSGVRGELWQGAVLGAISGAAAKVAENIVNGETWHDGVTKAAAVGAVAGAVAGGTLVTTVVSKSLTHAKRAVDWVAVGRAAASGAVSGALSD